MTDLILNSCLPGRQASPFMEKGEIQNNRTAILNQKPVTPVKGLLQSQICCFSLLSKEKKNHSCTP